MRDRTLAVDPWLLLLLPLLAAVFSVAQAAALRLLGGTVGRINLGVGPVVWTRGVVALRPLPLGCSVEVGRPDDGGAAFDALALPLKLALLLSGPAVLVLLAAVSAQWSGDLALLCAGLGLFNLLPLPTLSGGQSMLAVWTAATGRQPSGAVLAAWGLAGMVALAGAVGWLFSG